MLWSSVGNFATYHLRQWSLKTIFWNFEVSLCGRVGHHPNKPDHQTNGRAPEGEPVWLWVLADPQRWLEPVRGKRLLIIYATQDLAIFELKLTLPLLFRHALLSSDLATSRSLLLTISAFCPSRHAPFCPLSDRVTLEFFEFTPHPLSPLSRVTEFINEP